MSTGNKSSYIGYEKIKISRDIPRPKNTSVTPKKKKRKK